MKNKVIIGIIIAVTVIALIIGAVALVNSNTAGGSDKKSSSSSSSATNLEFRLNDDGEGYTVVGIGDCEDREIIIPSKYNKKPVTAIGDCAFFNNADIKSITIPDTVETIGDYAFYWCYDLRKVSFGNGVKSIGAYAFYGCYDLREVSFGKSIKSIGAYAFYGCYSIKDLTLPDSLTEVGDCAFANCSDDYNEYGNALYLGSKSNPYLILMKAKDDDITSCEIHPDTICINSGAFYNCNSLQYNAYNNGLYLGNESNPYVVLIKPVDSYATSYIINPNTKFIDSDAFDYCSYLDSITIPSSVIAINTYFTGTNFTSIEVEEDNEHFQSINGNLYDKLGKTLIKYAPGKTDQSFTLPASVTTIRKYAISDRYYLKNITLPKSLRSVESGAFSYYYGYYDNLYYNGTVEDWCKINFGGYQSNPMGLFDHVYFQSQLLTEVVIPDSVTRISQYAFYGCDSIETVVVGDSVKKIGENAFGDCTSLNSITFGESFEEFNHSIISESNSIKSITVHENNKNFKSIDGNLYTKDGKTLIKYASGKTNTSFTLPSTVTEIGDCALQLASSLTYVTLNDSLKTIGDSAFYYCTALTSIDIGNSVTKIGYNAFSYCSSLTDVNIGSGVTKIDGTAFYMCESLSNITVSGDNKKFKSNNGNLYTKDGTKLIKYAPAKTNKTFTLPSSVTEIEEYAFRDAKNLTTVTLHDSLTSIGDNAFYSCESLTSIFIPDSVTEIGYEAFYDCTSLSIRCEAESKPEGWDDSWNELSWYYGSDIPTTWGCDY